MAVRLLALLFLVLTPLAAHAAQAAAPPVPYKIVTASERGTYIQIGRDLGKFIIQASEKTLVVTLSSESTQ
jgi:TRAP-type uncharacterized transport system substrate-binding protein